MNFNAQVVTLEREGSRVYFTGNTYPIKDRIKGLGGHWDSESRMWWVGIGKLDAAQKLLTNTVDTPATIATEDLDTAKVSTKIRYRDRTYFVIAESCKGDPIDDRLRLATLKGADTFWVDANDCKVLKTYRSRESGYGRYRRTEYTTLGSLRRFVASQEKAKEAGMEACPCCGKRGPLHHDLEDGMEKCFGCCDIPE